MLQPAAAAYPTRYACDVQVLLEGLTQSEQTPIDAVSLLSAGERQMVLHTFNWAVLDSRGGPYEKQTIHGMLEFWAAATPAAPAVEFEACHAFKSQEVFLGYLAGFLAFNVHCENMS